ncbi:MAG TPA: hypothetical protein VKB95_03140 [Chitinophagaceae bacterium]|nr:hypothetical protein [Chitinophagaceae bacterium]
MAIGLVFPQRNFREINREWMKLLFTCCFILLFAWLAWSIKNQRVADAIEKPSPELKDTIHFASQIQPILVKNCSPCHFTGGKMYERMPFDKDTTIINHEAGVLRRIKGEENLLIKTFILQNKTEDN